MVHLKGFIFDDYFGFYLKLDFKKNLILIAYITWYKLSKIVEEENTNTLK